MFDKNELSSQDKSFVDYLTENFLSNESSSSCNQEICLQMQTKLQTWPFSLNLNHPNVRPIVKHLTQLEQQDKIDTGQLIEIQNRLNQLARFGKWFLPQIQFIINEIQKNNGK